MIFFKYESGLVLDMIIPFLYPKILVGNLTGTPESLNICCNEIDSSVSNQTVHNYTGELEVSMVSRLLLYHIKGIDPTWIAALSIHCHNWSQMKTN